MLRCRQGTALRHDAPSRAQRFGVSQRALFPSSTLRVSTAHPQINRLAASAADTQEGETATTEGDVYLYEPMPLKEGIEKHTISVFVADESGLINRVAGVFARRGVNIESLAVGLNIDKALFTIVVNDTPKQIANVCKQLNKLVNVRYAADITPDRRIERELMLLKLSAPAGPARTEVLQLAEIFRARVVDVSEHRLTLSVAGDPGKTLAFQKVMKKFGVLEVARTGKITLKRGLDLLQMGAWNDNVARRAQIAKEIAAASAVEPTTAEVRQADVYAVDPALPGVWDIENILDASYDPSESHEFEPHTISVDVSDSPGVLNEVTGVFARRGYNVQSLAVGPSEKAGRSRITMVVPGQRGGISNLLKQLSKLVVVETVTDLTDIPHVARELMLIKVRCTSAQRGELHNLVQIFRGTMCDVSPDTVTIEVQGKEDKMKALQGVLEPYGILEIARTGRVSLARESGVDTRFLSKQYLNGPW